MMGETKDSKTPLPASLPAGVRAKTGLAKDQKHFALPESHNHICSACLPFQEMLHFRKWKPFMRDGTFGMLARAGLSAAAWTSAHGAIHTEGLGNLSQVSPHLEYWVTQLQGSRWPFRHGSQEFSS